MMITNIIIIIITTMDLGLPPSAELKSPGSRSRVTRSIGSQTNSSPNMNSLLLLEREVNRKAKEERRKRKKLLGG